MKKAFTIEDMQNSWNKGREEALADVIQLLNEVWLADECEDYQDIRKIGEKIKALKTTRSTEEKKE